MRKFIITAAGFFIVANLLVSTYALPPPNYDELFNKCDVAVTAKLVDIQIEPVSPPYGFNVSLHYHAEHFWVGSDKQDFVQQLNIFTANGEDEIRSYHITEHSYLIFYDHLPTKKLEGKTCPGYTTPMDDRFHEFLLEQFKINH